MGGYGSGRHNKAHYTVEEARTLDLKEFTDYWPFTPGETYTGRLTWRNSADEVTGSIDYQIHTDILSGWVRLFYTVGGTTDMNYTVSLTKTRPHFGGSRWWFVCPCGGRARKLYLAPRGTRFACRACNRLTYESTQQHDPRLSAFWRNPEAALAAMQSGDPRAGFLAAKAVLSRKR